MKKRLVFLPLLLAAFGFSAFVRSTGSDHVRAVQILALIATGMCLGVALANLRALFGAKLQD
jgi:hypothetical protein